MLLDALENKPGVAREIVTLNAGTALYPPNVVESFEDGIDLAREDRKRQGASESHHPVRFTEHS